MDIFNRSFKNVIKSRTSYKFAAVISVMTTVGMGLISSWSSPAVPRLTSQTSSFPVSEFQAAWIASVLGWGIIFGFIINAVLVDKMGSKRTLLFLAAPQILSWIIIYFGKNWLLLCFARIIGGFGYGAGLCTTAIYLSEIGDEKTRGVFLSLVKLSINIGIFVGMIFGAFLSYDMMNLVSIFIPIVFVFAFFPMPNKKDIREDDFDDGVQEQLWQNNFDDVRKQRITDGNEEDSNVFANEANDLKAPSNNLTESKNRFHDHPGVFDEDSGLTQRQHNLAESSNSLKQHPVAFPDDTGGLNQHPNNSNGLNHQPDVLIEDKDNCIKHQNGFTKNEINSAENIKGPELITPPFENERQKMIKDCKEAKGEERAEIKVDNSLKNGTIEAEISKLLQNGSPCPSEPESSKNVWWKLFVLKNNRKALMIILLIGLTDILSGHVVIATYTQQIFEFSGASLGPEYAALILSALKMGASLISTLVVEKFSRRSLLLTTSIFAGLIQGSVALFYLLKLYLKIDVSWITWWPLFGVSLFELAGNVGIGNLYFVSQGELLSDDVKGLGITFSNIFYDFVSFFLKLYFQIIIHAIGIYSVFFGFAICCTAGSCLVYWLWPETQGKSKKEIKKLLM